MAALGVLFIPGPDKILLRTIEFERVSIVAPGRKELSCHFGGVVAVLFPRRLRPYDCQAKVTFRPMLALVIPFQDL